MPPSPVIAVRAALTTALAGAVLLGGAADAAPAGLHDAQDPPHPAVTWYCWYAPMRVNCIRGHAGPDGADDPMPHGATATGDAPPGRYPQPQSSHSRPELLHIPLYGVPGDMQGVAQLATAVLCRGQRTSCTARFGLREAWAELDRLMDPVIGSAN